uniref:Acb2/Tad1 hairpin domain-containing protein n=1 Tax=viral metagenome TaxID=1070528 RepID=A0A6M3XR01_9ZZZZ
MISQADIDKRFTYHPPKGDREGGSHGQIERYTKIRAQAKALAELVCAACPESREASLALTKIEESVFWANAAIARNE